MLTSSQKQDIVSKIKNSNTLSNARTSSALLQYLYESTLKGGNLKEEVIDIEFYGKREFTEKNNPRVRVNVYNLRKKLVTYYEKEGKDDKWQLSIEKGQYQVSFILKDKRNNISDWFRWPIALPYLALLITLITLVYTNMPAKMPSIWHSILSKNKVTNVYVGDALGMNGMTITGQRGWTRSFGINNYPDYNKLVRQNPKLKNKIKPSSYTYSTSMILISIQKFQQFFQERNKAFTIRFSTRTSASEIMEGNAIYIGSIGNDNSFIQFFNEANQYCKINSRSFQIKNPPIYKDTTYNINTYGESEEYAFVSKYPAQNNTEHLVFFSRHDIGVSATVDYFTNPDSISSFIKNYLDDKKYFTAIFKVKGQDRANTSLHLETVIPF